MNIMQSRPGPEASISSLNAVNESSSLERLIELHLMSELTQEAWFGRGLLVDVLHSSVDAFGHDVVLECGSVLRHVQLKSRALAGKTSRYAINTRLAERPSGCVIWIGWEREPRSNRLRTEYRWFGEAPGSSLPPLGDTIAKHSKANAEGVKLERPGMRIVPLSRFEKLAGVGELIDRLFGAGTPT
jgi:hypothetical protein